MSAACVDFVFDDLIRYHVQLALVQIPEIATHLQERTIEVASFSEGAQNEARGEVDYGQLIVWITPTGGGRVESIPGVHRKAARHHGKGNVLDDLPSGDVDHS